MKTLLDILNEAKVDDEYNKSWSMIDRDIFDRIVLADPKTSSDADGIKSIGFVAKQFLLPKYRDGDKDFINNLESVKDAVAKYETNPGKYAKLAGLKTVADFVTYMDNPDAVIIEEPIKEPDAITKIYNQYYSDIDRADFDKIIAMDPQTTDKSIGEIAKNILLVSYRKKENILDKEKEINNVCKDYYAMKDKLPADKQQLTSYKSTQEFISYILEGPESTLVASLKANETVDPTTHRMVKDDFRIVGSTFDYDILEPKSHRASFAISGGYQTADGMRWCTGWEPDMAGNVVIAEHDMHWNSYTSNGGRLFCFMNKKRYRGSQNREVNWQCQIRHGDLIEFLNGSDSADYPGATKPEQFKNFLFAHPDIYKAIKNKEPFDSLLLMREVEAELKYAQEPFVVDSVKQIAILETSNLSKICKEIIFNIEKIPVAICASFIALNNITFMEGVKEIGDQAFMNCSTLKTLVFPESLEIIGKEAFQNCPELRGSIRIPDGVKEIKTRAFAEDKCRLKVNKDRKTKLKFDAIDKEWVTIHVQTIEVK